MIQRITTLMTSQATLADLNQAMDRLNKTQEQLATGKRINKPSDDPYGMGLSLQLQSDLSALNDYSSNVTDGTAWAQAADTSLSNMGSMVQRIRELTVEAANGSNSPSNMAADAQEVDQLIAAIKQEANAQFSGQYIFSGTATTQQPYTQDVAGVPPNDAYGGGSGNIDRVVGPNNTTVTVNADVSSLLGSGPTAADGKLLDVLRTISSDMRSGNVSALGGADVSKLDTNMSTLTQLQATIGATENRLQLAASRIQDLQLSDNQALSNTQDADMAQTEINYSTEQAAFTAALKASANIVQSSLMNFLSSSGG